MWLNAGMITWTQFLERVPPTNFGGGQKSHKFEAISDNFRVSSQISLERIDVTKISKLRYKLQIHPYRYQCIYAYDFGASGSSLTKLNQATCQEAAVITWVQLLGRVPNKIWEGKKNLKNSARFWTTFDSDRKYL